MENTPQLQNIKENALQAIQDELQSLQVLSQYINDGFAEAVLEIYQSKGRLIVTGIGKSAIIAQKIVATLNSTGQPAVYMHAADAIHGDLGIIQKDDVVLAISKSGNTPEIKALAPLLKRFGHKLICMVGNTNSDLARLSDYIIDTTIDKEACPNNLAPTTSTTAQIIMGDALAIALLKMRNFTPADFGKYHPGGALGKKLYLTCGEIAAVNHKPKVLPTAAFKEVISAISASLMGAVAVIDEQARLMGIITDGDVRRCLELNTGIDRINADQMMNQNPRTIQSNDLASEAAAVMQNHKVSQLIVLSGDQYNGMVHIHDLYKEGIL